MLTIENPDKLNTLMKAVTAGVQFEIVYQRGNAMEYLFRILRDGVLDSKLTIMREVFNGEFVFLYFTDKNDHYILSKFHLNLDVVRDRSKFILWITEKFIDRYKQ